MSSLIDGLKQRKLVPWAVAYVAGGWALLEVLDFLRDNFELSVLLVQGVTALVVVGFFAVLVVAWYHGEKGWQRVSGPELLILAMLFLIAGLGVRFVTGRGSTAGGSVGASSVIAVLPFDNFSPDPDDAYLANGLTEEITSQLAKVGDLQVISRIAVTRAMESDLSLSEISRTLGVGSVLEGSVRKAGSQIRITAQLIDAATNEHLWSRDFDRELEDIFALQTEVALAIVRAMQAELTPEEEAAIQTAPTTDENAYAMYLRSLEPELSGNQPTLNRSAIELLKLAVELDPNFADAWARLAWRYVWESRMGSPTGADSAVVLARHALDLAPGSAVAHYALGSAFAALGRVTDLTVAFEDALAADPGHVPTLDDFSFFMAISGREAAALEMVIQSVALVPQRRQHPLPRVYPALQARRRRTFGGVAGPGRSRRPAGFETRHVPNVVGSPARTSCRRGGACPHDPRCVWRPAGA